MLSPYSSYVKELRKTKIYFDQDFNHQDRISAVCNHKDDRSTMDIDFKGYTPNGEMIVSCKICGKCFTITKYSQKEVGDALNLLYNTFQTLKMFGGKGLQLPPELLEICYHLKRLSEFNEEFDKIEEDALEKKINELCGEDNKETS